MLSTSVISSSGQASSYFMEQDDYYSKEGENFEKPSVWYGKGAEKLKLEGAVDKKTYFALLNGEVPNAEQIGLQKSGEIKHRPGFDLALSVPKSWSIAHFATKDLIFSEITEKAAKFVADMIERDCAMASEYKDGKQHVQLTGNLVMALHFHRLSRALDPQDHIHINVMNMTERADGKWRALKSGNPNTPIYVNSEGFLERVRARKKEYGELFSLQIAHLAQEAGLDIVFDEKGKWELKGVPKEMIEAFSTRSHQIKEDMEQKGVFGASAAEASALATRESKKKWTREQILSDINSRFSQFSEITMKNLGRSERLNEEIAVDQDKEQAKKAIEFAISHLSEKNGILTEEKILVCAMRQFQAKPSVSALLKAIQDKEIDKTLLVFDNNGARRFVSSVNVEREKKILSNLQVFKDRASPSVCSKVLIQKWITKHGPDLGSTHKEAINALFCSKANISLVDCKSQEANVLLVPMLAHISRFANHEAIILSTTKIEAEQTQLSTRAKCMTVSAYIKNIEMLENSAKSQNSKLDIKRQVIIVSDSHRLSTKQGADLLAIQEKHQNKSILVHDSKQAQSLQPGQFVGLLERGGVQSYKINRMMANNTNFEVKRHEIESKQDRLDRISTDYVGQAALFPQKSVLIVAQNKTDVSNLNKNVQEKLIENGLVGKKSIELVHHQQQYLTQAQLTKANQYREEQVVSFSKNYNSLGIVKNHYYNIEAVCSNSNKIILQSSSGRIVWDPSNIAGNREGVVRVFQKETFLAHENDKLCATYTSGGVSKGRNLRLESVTKGSIKIKDDRGKVFSVKKDDELLKHLSLAYAKQPSSAYSDKPELILSEQDSKTRLTHAKQYYQLLSQAKEKVEIYTDNVIGHSLALKKYKGESSPVVNHLLDKLKAKENKLENSNERAQQTLSDINRAASIAVKKEMALSSYLSNKECLNSDKALAKLLRYSVSTLSENEAVFSKHGITAEIIKHAKRFQTTVNFDRLDKKINLMVEKGGLVSCPVISQSPLFTTKQAIKLEASIFQNVRSLQNTTTPFFKPSELSNGLKLWQESHKKLTDSQRLAVEGLLSSSDKINLVNGLAGVGKTTMLEAVNTLLSEQNVQLVGLAPTNEAMRQLSLRGIESHTLDSYLGQLSRMHQDGRFDPSKRVLLVLDEASMASSKKFSQLLTLTKDSQTSLAFVGDIKQLPAIEQGKMFFMLQKLGVKTHLVDEIVRQKNHPEYLKIIQNIYKGDFNSAIHEMDKKGLIYEDKQLLKDNPELKNNDLNSLNVARIEKLCSIISSQEPERRDNTCVITPANKDRKLYNQLYRETLKATGELGQNDHKTTVLVSASLGSAEKAQAQNYRVGQVVLFNQLIADCDVKKGEYFAIREIYLKRNYLIIENDSGQKTGVNASRFRGSNSKNISVYNVEERGMAVNDRIRWRYTDKALGRINMQEARVSSVADGKATVILQDKTIQTLFLDKKNDNHWDHAYASTVYTEQGNTKQHAALLMLSSQKNLASQPGFLVAMTRAIESGILVTDSKEKLITQLEFNSGEKTSALEALGYSKPEKTPIQVNIKQSKQVFKDAFVTQKVRFDINAVNDSLHKNAEHIAVSLLGNPRRRSSTDCFFGTKNGSLAVSIKGPYQGTWKDFDTGEKGNMLSLIKREMRLDFSQALEQAAKWASVLPENLPKQNQNANQRISTKADELGNYQLAQIKRAQTLAQESTSIKGTLAEKYLSETRGIKQTEWPKDARFHPGIYTQLNGVKLPALILVARDSKLQVQSIQAIYLNPLTGEKADVAVKKQTIGSPKGALFCASTNSKSSKAIVCEGPEDALSISKSMPDASVYACFGKSNFNNLPDFRGIGTLVLALDNDGKKPSEMPNIERAIHQLASKNMDVFVAQPPVAKQDYNDILKDKAMGEKAVMSVISSATLYQSIDGKLASSAGTLGPNTALTKSAGQASPTTLSSSKGSDLDSFKANQNAEKLHSQRQAAARELEI